MTKHPQMLSLLLCASLLILSCLSLAPAAQATIPPAPPTLITFPPPTFTPTLAATQAITATPHPPVPEFTYIVLIILENKEFGTVIGNPQMPIFNQLANDYTLLTQYYAIRHPSLPNYLALISGNTQGVISDCTDCFTNAKSLPDLIEASGRTWKAYEEDMSSPCQLGDTLTYFQKHNPFLYFNPIRLDAARCQAHDVPLSMLQTDIGAGSLPNFMFITPNICNDAHSCGVDIADSWLAGFLTNLVPALDKTGKPYLVILDWDEGQGNHSCCGLPQDDAGGRVPVVLLSPQVKNKFQDDTPYTHYSLLKTISASWGLPYLGHAADDSNVLITAPWK